MCVTWHAIHVIPPMLCIGWGSMRPASFFWRLKGSRPSREAATWLAAWASMGILGIWETYRLSSSHHKHPCFTSSIGGMNKDNQRARTNYSWTWDFGKSMIKSDSETFIFYIRQRDVGITWPNHAESGPCYYMCVYI